MNPADTWITFSSHCDSYVSFFTPTFTEGVLNDPIAKRLLFSWFNITYSENSIINVNTTFGIVENPALVEHKIISLRVNSNSYWYLNQSIFQLSNIVFFYYCNAFCTCSLWELLSSASIVCRCSFQIGVI